MKGITYMYSNVSVVRTNLSSYENLNKNSSGANGFVQRVSNTEVVKRYYFEKYPASDFLLELAILRRCKHQNIVELTNVYVDEKTLELALGLELVPHNLLEVLSFDTLSYKGKINITYGILCGIGYLHSRGVIHGDIKPENILMSGSRPKICDFGQSAFSEEYSHVTENKLCTFYYRSPEIVLCPEKPYTFGIDIWATGITIWELFLDKPPFDGDEEDLSIFINHMFSWLGSPSKEDGEWILNTRKYLTIPLMGLLSHTERPEMKEQLGILYSIIRPMLLYDPEHRIPIVEVLKNELFNDSRDLLGLEAEPDQPNSQKIEYEYNNTSDEFLTISKLIKTISKGKNIETFTSNYVMYLLDCYCTRKPTKKIPNKRLAIHLLNIAENITSVNPYNIYNKKMNYSKIEHREEIISLIEHLL